MKTQKTLLALGLTATLFVITLTLSPVQQEVISSEKADKHHYVSHLSEADKSFYESLEQAGIKKTPEEFAADEVRRERMQKFLTANPELVKQSLEAMIEAYQQDSDDLDEIIDHRTIAEVLGNSAHPVLFDLLSQNSNINDEEALFDQKLFVLEMLVSQAYSSDEFDYENVLIKLNKLANSPQVNDELKEGINVSILRIISSTAPKERALNQAAWQMTRVMPILTLGGLGGLLDFEPTVYDETDSDIKTLD